MSKDEILNMPAGRELDALVAEKLGLYRNALQAKLGDAMLYIGVTLFYVPQFSTNISDAWKVVEKLIDYQHNKFAIFAEVIDGGLDVYECNIRTRHHNQVKAIADTAQLAICRAALLAVCE